MFSPAGENAEVSMDVSLAYRDDTLAEWTEMAHERVPRKLKCTFTSPKVGHLISKLMEFVFGPQVCGKMCPLFLSIHGPLWLLIILCLSREKGNVDISCLCKGEKNRSVCLKCFSCFPEILP
jgi:hypothetical protein